MSEFDIILNKIQLFDKMYDSMRIVDPVKKEVFEIKEGQLFKSKEKCYKFLDKKTFCKNCISMRAYNKNDSIYIV